MKKNKIFYLQQIKPLKQPKRIQKFVAHRTQTFFFFDRHLHQIIATADDYRSAAERGFAFSIVNPPSVGRKILQFLGRRIPQISFQIFYRSLDGAFKELFEQLRRVRVEAAFGIVAEADKVKGRIRLQSLVKKCVVFDFSDRRFDYFLFFGEYARRSHLKFTAVGFELLPPNILRKQQIGYQNQQAKYFIHFVFFLHF